MTSQVMAQRRAEGDHGGVLEHTVRPPVPPIPSSFPVLLRGWRQRRRLSQLGLAQEAGISQRHLSCLESGKAQPSRAMVMQLSRTLEVPLRERNDWLLAAGFAPAFQARTLEDPAMAPVLAAVQLMLRCHAPYPALALDRAWNILLTNAPFEHLMAGFGADLWTRIGGRNSLRLMFHPAGLRPWVANWEELAPLLWHRACQEAAARGGAEMQAVLAELAPLQGPIPLRTPAEAGLLPVVPVVLEQEGLRLSLFAVIATFGTPQDLTTDELRIETFFPADDATEAVLRRQPESTSPTSLE